MKKTVLFGLSIAMGLNALASQQTDHLERVVSIAAKTQAERQELRATLAGELGQQRSQLEQLKLSLQTATDQRDDNAILTVIADISMAATGTIAYLASTRVAPTAGRAVSFSSAMAAVSMVIAAGAIPMTANKIVEAAKVHELQNTLDDSIEKIRQLEEEITIIDDLSPKI
jgi:hypothetical protein